MVLWRKESDYQGPMTMCRLPSHLWGEIMAKGVIVGCMDHAFLGSLQSSCARLLVCKNTHYFEITLLAVSICPLIWLYSSLNLMLPSTISTLYFPTGTTSLCIEQNTEMRCGWAQDLAI